MDGKHMILKLKNPKIFSHLTNQKQKFVMIRRKLDLDSFKNHFTFKKKNHFIAKF